MGNMDVTARLLADNASFDAAMKRSAESATATGAATEKAAKRGADAQKFASKFIGDAVTKQSAEHVAALNRVRAAQADYSRAVKVANSGYLSAGQGTQTMAAALQRLTAVQKQATETQQKLTKGTRDYGVAVHDVAERVIVGSVGYIAAAASIRGITDAVRDAIASSLEFAETIHRTSVNTGLAAGTLSTLHFAAGVTGGDFEALTKGVGKMDATIASATEGNKQAAAVMKALGLNAAELANSPNGAETAFKKLSQTLAGVEDPIRRVELASKLLGQRMGVNQIATLVDVGNHFDEYRQKAMDAGMYLDGPMAEQLARTQQRLKELGQKVDGAKLSFTEGLTPGLNKFLDLLAGGGPKMSVFTRLGGELGKQLNFMAAAAYSFAASLATIEAYTMDGGKLTADGRHMLADSERWRAKAEKFDAAAKAPATAESAGPSMESHGSDKSFHGFGDLTGAGDAAAKKALRDKLKSFEVALAEMKQQTSVSVKAEFDYWTQRIDAFKRGSDEYNAIVEKQASLAVAGARAAHELVVKFRRESGVTAGLSSEEATKGMAEFNNLMRQQAEDVSRTGERWKSYNAELTRSQLLIAKQAASMREMQLRDGVKSGAITKHAAAQGMEEIHAQEAVARIAALKVLLDSLIADEKNLDPNAKGYEEKKPQLVAQQVGIQNEMARAEGEAQIQAMQDRFEVFSQTGLGGAMEALQEFTASSKDSAAQMKSMVSNTIDGVNKAILRDLTEKNYQRRFIWTDLGKNLFSNVAGTALKKGEGAVMGALGLGGKMGTRGNPMYTKAIDDISAGASAAPSWLSKLMGGAGGAAKAAGGGIGGIFSAILPLIAGFADGGDVAAGTTAMVGERGPELVRFGSAAHVTPNHKLGAGGGGGGSNHTWNIDARGSTNPAQTMAMVQQGILAATPHIIKAASMSSRDQNSRLPQGARR